MRLGLLLIASSAICLARRVQPGHDTTRRPSQPSVDAPDMDSEDFQDKHISTMRALASALAASSPDTAFAAVAPRVPARHQSLSIGSEARSSHSRDARMMAAETLTKEADSQDEPATEVDEAAQQAEAVDRTVAFMEAVDPALEEKMAGIYGTPLVVGLSHKTAPVQVREKLAIPENKWNEAARVLVSYDAIKEAAVLSTCNRFELYLFGVGDDSESAEKAAIEFLLERSNLEEKELRENLFVKHDRDAVFHLFRVASGLDSLVIGENQILFQVKKMLFHACNVVDGLNKLGSGQDEVRGSSGKLLRRMLNSAVGVGKRVRTETDISHGSISISSAAVELAQKRALPDARRVFDDLRVTIVGAGDMTRLLLESFGRRTGLKKLTLINRSRPRADKLAEQYSHFDIEVLTMESFEEVQKRSDLIFTSTSATECIITEESLEKLGFGGEDANRLMLVDISVPMNVDVERVNKHPMVHAYSVDDLKQVMEENTAKRAGTVKAGEGFCEGAMDDYYEWKENLKYVPILANIYSGYEKKRRKSFKRLQKQEFFKELDAKEQAHLEAMSRTMLNRLISPPREYMRQDVPNEHEKIAPDELQKFFGLKKV